MPIATVFLIKSWKWQDIYIYTPTVTAWQSITKEKTQHLVMSISTRLQAVITRKGFHPSIRYEHLIFSFSFVQLLLKP